MNKTAKGIGSAVALAAAIAGGYLARGGNTEVPAVVGEYTVFKTEGGVIVDSVTEHNALVAGGIRYAWQLFAGDTVFPYDTAAYICVGNSATATDTSMTALQGASKFWGNVDSLSYGADYIQYFYTFHTADANFSWQEFALFNDSAGTMFNRATSAVGTKTVADTWILRLRLRLQ